MNNEVPPTKSCSRCGQLLEPYVHGYITDGDGKNPRPCYGYGHVCPALNQEYENRVQEISQNGSLSSKERNEQFAMAQYMNTWSN